MPVQNTNGFFAGRVVHWDGRAGYGFIRVDAESAPEMPSGRFPDIFFNLTVYRNDYPPCVGDPVFFTLLTGARCFQAASVVPRTQATSVAMLSPADFIPPAPAVQTAMALKADDSLPTTLMRRQRPAPSSQQSCLVRLGQYLVLSLKSLSGFCVAAIWFYLLSISSTPLFMLYFILSIALFTSYSVKQRTNEMSRSSEAKLHLLALFGGWAGGIIGRYFFNYHPNNRWFTICFWLMIILNIALTYLIIFVDFSEIPVIQNLRHGILGLYADF